MDGQIIGWIATVVISILGARMAAVKTIKNDREQFGKESNRKEMQKAVEMAEYYQRELLYPVSIIESSCSKNSQKRIGLSCIPFTSGKTILFTSEEAISHTKEKDLRKYTALCEDDILGLKAILPALKMRKVYEFEDESSHTIASFYGMQAETLLNKLEFWCMYFNMKIADEDVVYQCLHQTFLSAVQLLYFDISEKNQGNIKDKYYVNIIKMFNRWNQKDVQNNEAILQKELEKESVISNDGDYKNKGQL